MIKPVLDKKISYLTISDIHELHPLNETQYIADSIFHYFDGFSSMSRFTSMDAIFIAGDIFHDYVSSKDPNVAIVIRWMRLLMEFCAKHNIILRVLEGTPGHDFKQARLFQSVADVFGDRLDYKYITELDIEYLPTLGLHVLYIPDEWKQSAAKARIDFEEKLREHGIEQVDIACIHGLFEFQIPVIKDDPLVHDSSYYLEKVKYFINIGHDHIFKTFDRILVQGSFDRISHGEEGRKGGIICHLDPVVGNSWEFVENIRARIFKTITVKTKDLDKGIEQVKKVLRDLPNNAHVRISTTPDNPILSVVDEFAKTHPDMRFKKHKDKKQLEEQGPNKLQEAINLNESFISISITPDNIVSLVLEELKDILNSDEDKELLSGELLTIIN